MTPTLPQATGRLTWLPLCEYKGDGRVVSLTQAGKEIQVFSLHLFVLVPALALVLVLHQGDRETEDCGRNEDGDQGALPHHDDGGDDDDNEEDEVEDDGSDEDDVGDQGAVHHQAQLHR